MNRYRFTTEQMLEVYRGHPLSKDRLLARVGRTTGIVERDLAYDPITEVTDQNHIGTAAFVLKLADRSRVTSADRVLDLGCGIGGPARLLSSELGCRVHGIDANVERVNDARHLSAITGLTESTSFEAGDFMRFRFNPEYTIVWGQNSWIHVFDRAALATLALSALVPGGRIAFDDVCLRRDLSGDSEREAYDEISLAWRSSIVPVTDWCDAFSQAGAEVELVEEDSEPYVSHYVKLTELARARPDDYPPHEIRGWECARTLGESGTFGFYRIVARRP